LARFLPFCRETWTSLSTADLDKNDCHVVVRLGFHILAYAPHCDTQWLAFTSSNQAAAAVHTQQPARAAYDNFRLSGAS